MKTDGILPIPNDLPGLSGVQLTSNGDVTIVLGTERNFHSVNEFDPTGDIYSSALQKVNANCLAHFGMRPHQVGFLPKDWHEWPGAEGLIEEIRAALRKSRDWQKDLSASSSGNEILAPLYAEALRREGIFDFTFIICFSNPLERVPESANSAAEPEDERSVGLRLKYLLNALLNTKGMFRRVVPLRAHLASLKALPIPPLESPNFDGWPSIVQEAYDLCLHASQDESGFNEGKFDLRMEELCDELRVLDCMTNAVDLPDDRMTLSWQGGKSETPYGPTPGWQTFRVMIDAPFAAKIQFDPYQTPCYFWIRRATWIRLGGATDAVIKPGPNGILEEIGGLKRLSIFGPGSAMLQSQGLAELEIEFLIQANDVILKNLILELKSRTESQTGVAAR